MVKIRLLAESDIQEIVNNFKKNNWPKPPSTFEPHLKEQRLGERIIPIPITRETDGQ